MNSIMQHNRISLLNEQSIENKVSIAVTIQLIKLSVIS